MISWTNSWLNAFFTSNPTTREHKERPKSTFEGKDLAEINEMITNGVDLFLGQPKFEVKQHPIKANNININNNINIPKHTNRWWQNLILNQGTGYLPLYPYIIQCNDTGLIICYPAKVTNNDYVISPFVANWQLSLDNNQKMTRKISSIDDLSVTLNWDNQLTAYLIRSCPYITLNVNNSKVKFKTIHAILSVKIENQRCLIQLNNGQLWAFYTNNNNMAYTNTLNEIQMNINYTGILRIVLIPEPFDNNLKVIDQFYTSYPIGGIVNYEFPTSNQAYLHFNFKKGGSNLPLLMLALPHHIDCMINPSSNNLIGYNCLKGNLTAIISDQWTLYEELNNQIQWFSNNPLNNNYINSITNALLQDINIEIDSNIKDPYFFGKGLAKIARLCLIAESVNKKELISNLLIKIKKYIEPWLSGNNENKFIYDNYWGGILTINGYDDSGADFGNGNYNDHHFHYGYFLYACAIIGKYDPGWVIWWREPIQVLIRDFASPSKNDIYFPQFRYKDWFDGHSWASGLFEFGDGKNQESTSESVNAYYSMYLIAIILQNNDLINISNLLLTSEIRSSKKYWHMTNNTSVYPVPFKNNKTVGVLWNTKVDYATWFGKNVEFIHCIQMLPFTPISHLLLDKQWVQECYPILSTALTRQDPPLSEGWKTFLFMAQAVFDKEKAVVNFNNSNKGMDDGNTLSNTLYWFATQQ